MRPIQFGSQYHLHASSNIPGYAGDRLDLSKVASFANACNKKNWKGDVYVVSSRGQELRAAGLDEAIKVVELPREYNQGLAEYLAEVAVVLTNDHAGDDAYVFQDDWEIAQASNNEGAFLSGLTQHHKAKPLFRMGDANCRERRDERD